MRSISVDGDTITEIEITEETVPGFGERLRRAQEYLGPTALAWLSESEPGSVRSSAEYLMESPWSSDWRLTSEMVASLSSEFSDFDWDPDPDTEEELRAFVTEIAGEGRSASPEAADLLLAGIEAGCSGNPGLARQNVRVALALWSHAGPW